MIKKIITRIFVLLSFLLLFGCEEKVQEKENTIPNVITNVNINIVDKKTHAIWIDFSGKTQAIENVEISSRVNGEIKEILFKAGQEVKKGQVLFKIDDNEYKIILAQKESNLRKSKASLNLANANVKRYKPLVKKQLVSKEKLDELIASKKQLEAQVSVDKESIKQAKLNLEYCSVKATIDGQISKTILDTGNIVKTGSKLANIVQSSSLFVNFNPSANEVSMIKKYKSEKNPKVIVSPSTTNMKIKLNGYLDFIDNVSNTSTGTVALRATVINKDNILFPGTFVNIKLFITDKIPFIAIPPNTISQNQLGSYVLIVDENNKVQTKQISITYSNKELAVIKKGLKVGDKIIVSPINKLKNDQLVKTTRTNDLLEK